MALKSLRRRLSERKMLWVGTLPTLLLGALVVSVIDARPANTLPAHPAHPTFAKDVAPILYKNCTGCHHVGGIGPFPLFDYDSALAYKDEIRDRVSKGEMPPWHAVGATGVFKNDRRISAADRNTIIAWLDGGAKPGDLKKLPPKPTFATGWSIGAPDAVYAMPQEFTVPASGTVAYQHFTVPTNLTEDRWVQAYEIMPGARDVVHHVLVYAKSPPESPAKPFLLSPIARNRTLEPADPQPKKSWFAFLKPASPASSSSGGYGTLIASMAAGTNAIEFPPGTALRIPKGTTLTFTMHYTAHGHVMKDRTKVGFRFAKAPPDEEIIASQFTNEVFTIPAGAKDYAVPSEISLREPVRIWGLLPHTHLRGVRWLYKLQKADGTSDVVLDIPKYDFNWQTYYLFSKPLEVPKGATLKATAWYDNSAGNPDNPDPRVNVKDGQQTWEEMQYTGFFYSIPSRNRTKVATRQAAP